MSVAHRTDRADGGAQRPVVLVDVTDTLRSGWNAGIQRVVRGMVAGLAADPRLDVRPVVWWPQVRRFRTLLEDEALRLGEVGVPAPPAPEPPATAGLRRRVNGALDRVRLGRPARRAWSWVRLRWRPTELEARWWSLVLDPPPGALLLEVDAVWNLVEVDRRDLLPRLRRAGVRVVPFVHDLLPLQHPDWFVAPLVEVFDRTVRAQVAQAAVVMANSEDTAAAVRRLARASGRPELTVRVVQLGSEAPPAVAAGEVPAALRGRRYALVVGTVEPRKNQATLLSAFDLLGRDDLDLVVVGREGWHAEDVAEHLRAAAAAGGVHWLEGVDDPTLDVLYRSAFVVLVPSVTEGFGLPVVEALGRGVPVISSPGGALGEFGPEVEHAAADRPEEWAERLRAHLEDPDHHRARRAAAAAARLRTWDEVGADAAEVLLDVASAPAEGR
ncbi:MAG: glycosyltransferase [Microthrixaceae bacterium]